MREKSIAIDSFFMLLYAAILVGLLAGLVFICSTMICGIELLGNTISFGRVGVCGTTFE